MLSYYEILQINEDSTDADIKKAYRKMCKILHPDLHDNSKEANIIFNLLHEAYETLSIPEKRKSYNLNQKKTSEFDISKDTYDNLITGYKKIVKDYEIIVKDYDKIIKSKNKLENDLLEEIRILKQEKNQTNSVNTSIEESQEKLEIERKLIIKKENRKNKDSIQIFFWIFLVIVVFLIAMIPDGVWLILFLIGLPIYFFISAFKKLK